MRKRAYTLAEVIIVLVIMAVIAGISIKITKAKLESLISVNYYTAYSTLYEVTKVIADNFDKKQDGSYLKGGFTSNGCSAGQEKDTLKNTCISPVKTLPRKGKNFCEIFESYLNTSNTLGEKISGWSDSCSSTSTIADTTTDFKNIVPDMVLRNGMRLYNLSQSDPVEISDLSSAQLKADSNSAHYTNASGEVLYLAQSGYKVYVDLDGESGDSELWYDVYPFYITMNGNVIPAYDTSASAEETGANSKFHLLTNVYDQFVESNQVKIEKIIGNESYKNSACKAKRINSDTKYCSGTDVLDRCKQDGHQCFVEAVKRVTLLGY